MRNIIFIGVLGIAACSSNPKPPSASNDINKESEVVKNANLTADHAFEFVTVLSKLNEFHPLSTTIQYSEPRSTFSKKIIDALKLKGYGTQKVSADQGVNYIEIDDRTTPTKQSNTRFSITIADVTISRLYTSNNDTLSPVSAFEIKGTQPQYIEYRSDIEFTDDQDNFKQYANRAPKRASKKYTDLYIPQKQLLVQFSSDTLDIGREYKTAIKTLTESFGEGKRFTILACTSDSDIRGNTTALRGKRIQQELLALGISSEKTRSVDCSTERYSHKQQPNSVVLTLESNIQNANRPQTTPKTRYYGFF